MHTTTIDWCYFRHLSIGLSVINSKKLIDRCSSNQWFCWMRIDRANTTHHAFVFMHDVLRSETFDIELSHFTLSIADEKMSVEEMTWRRLRTDKSALTDVDSNAAEPVTWLDIVRTQDHELVDVHWIEDRRDESNETERLFLKINRWESKTTCLMMTSDNETPISFIDEL